MRHRPRTLGQPPRTAFTLVELLVAMGLTVFLMTILVEAFGSGMDTFRGLRSIGEMQDNLRSATNLLRADLTQDHFEGARKLSDGDFWTEPRREGYFYVEQLSAATSEGNDGDGIPSYRIADENVALRFSARTRSNRTEGTPADVSSSVATSFRSFPAIKANGNDLQTVYGSANSTSPWTEVFWFLKKSTTSEGGTQMYNLYRSQLLVMPSVDDLNAALAAGTVTIDTYPRLSRSHAAVKYSSINELALSSTYRPSLANVKAGTNFPAPSLVAANVLSFHVRLIRSTGAVQDPFVGIGASNAFDSAAANPGYRVLGAHITIRVHDPASGMSRQQTLIQDL